MHTPTACEHNSLQGNANKYFSLVQRRFGFLSFGNVWIFFLFFLLVFTLMERDSFRRFIQQRRRQMQQTGKHVQIYYTTVVDSCMSLSLSLCVCVCVCGGGLRSGGMWGRSLDSSRGAEFGSLGLPRRCHRVTLNFDVGYHFLTRRDLSFIFGYVVSIDMNHPKTS